MEVEAAMDAAVSSHSLFPFYSGEHLTQATAPEAVKREIFSSCGNGAVGSFEALVLLDLLVTNFVGGSRGGSGSWGDFC